MTTKSTKEKAMKMIYKNILLTLATALLAAPAMAQEAAASSVTAYVGSSVGWAALAVGFLMGCAVWGGTYGQSRAATAALEGIARNPASSGKLIVPLVLSLALMESLVLFAFIIGNKMSEAVVTALALIK
jgi:F-type H+-transporting ATPase subunit c